MDAPLMNDYSHNHSDAFTPKGGASITSIVTSNNLLSNYLVAELYLIPAATPSQRFEISKLAGLKFSFPRAIEQGDRFGRDMHGVQMSVLLVELEPNGLPAIDQNSPTVHQVHAD